MWQFIKRILFLVSFFFIYLILKEFLQLYVYLRTLHPYVGYGFLILLAVFLGYFAVIPLVRIVGMRHRISPTRDPEKIQSLIETRMLHFQANPYLRDQGFDITSIPVTRDGYYAVIDKLEEEMTLIRKRYVTQVFYGTAIAQNGFLDAILILSASINLVKEMFILYHGRVPNRELLSIARMVYLSMAIGGSESVEYATDEVLSKVFSGSIKGMPFASKILGSIADGFVNAALVTRISLITENYCKMLFIESEKALYPSYKSVIAATKMITSDLIERVGDEVKALTRDKAEEVLLATVNPVGYIMAKALNKYADGSSKLSPQGREKVRETSQIAHNPFGYTFRKIAGFFKRSR